MSCNSVNRYPGVNQYGNMPCVPYGYQGKNTLVKIQLGFRETPTIGSSNRNIASISLLSVMLRGYGTIQYGSTSASYMEITNEDFSNSGDNQTLHGSGSGVPLYIHSTDTHNNCPGLCLQIPCGVNSFEVVTMVWGGPISDNYNIDQLVLGGQSWVAVWHVDLVKCCVTAVSWTRVLNETDPESCTSFKQLENDNVQVSGHKYMNATLSKCCCSCTSNCCTKTTCPSDLDATSCDNDCTNILSLFSKSCEPCCSTNNKSCC